LGVIYVGRDARIDRSPDDIQRELTEILRQRLSQEFNVIPYLSVTVLEGP
jgi:hypothetical protein